MLNDKLVLAIDFDGTIAEDKYPLIGNKRKGVSKWINKLYDEGHYIIINTCRAGFFQGDAEAFLKENNIKYHYINCNHPDLISYYGSDCRKISADIYIDDKGLIILPSWKQKYKIIQKKYKQLLRQENNEGI